MWPVGRYTGLRLHGQRRKSRPRSALPLGSLNLLSRPGEGRKIPAPMPSPAFPLPVPGDASSVTQALEAGGADWGRGDFREAVRWVHRAADAAETAGDDARAVGLARAAADLMTVIPSRAPSPGDEAA